MLPVRSRDPAISRDNSSRSQCHTVLQDVEFHNWVNTLAQRTVSVQTSRLLFERLSHHPKGLRILTYTLLNLNMSVARKGRKILILPCCCAPSCREVQDKIEQEQFCDKFEFTRARFTLFHFHDLRLTRRHKSESPSYLCLPLLSSQDISGHEPKMHSLIFSHQDPHLNILHS